MTSARSAQKVIAHDLLFQVAGTADRYGLHGALDARLGRRGEVAYLWCVGRVSDAPAVRVRIGNSHPDAQAGLPVDSPDEGSVFTFRLRANVTHKDGQSGRRRSWKREEIEARLRWLERRSDEHGFRAGNVEAAVTRVFIRKGRGFWLDETTFTGRLIVTDRERFAKALTNGVGQRPAFGFGLLEII